MQGILNSLPVKEVNNETFDLLFKFSLSHWRQGTERDEESLNTVDRVDYYQDIQPQMSRLSWKNWKRFLKKIKIVQTNNMPWNKIKKSEWSEINPQAVLEMFWCSLVDLTGEPLSAPAPTASSGFFSQYNFPSSHRTSWSLLGLAGSSSTPHQHILGVFFPIRMLCHILASGLTSVPLAL